MPDDDNTPKPNSAPTRIARNRVLSDRLENNSDDIVRVTLTTLSTGKTTWTIVRRDGTRDQFANP